ncbi:hypothetical protein L1049_017640 [Liquidambar formosana]|uniref:Uncharacterized protein n=1 Tax=Liquidambar formosana TaxID=63359 RepID=A0AAP0X3V5_LIQFO
MVEMQKSGFLMHFHPPLTALANSAQSYPFSIQALGFASVHVAPSHGQLERPVLGANLSKSESPGKVIVMSLGLNDEKKVYIISFFFRWKLFPKGKTHVAIENLFSNVYQIPEPLPYMHV